MFIERAKSMEKDRMGMGILKEKKNGKIFFSCMVWSLDVVRRFASY